MKRSSIVAISALFASVFAFETDACGPWFPASYFPWTHDSVITNAAGQCHSSYSIRPHLGAELALIGAHYYPDWTGKAPKGNKVSTAEADKHDFFAAGAAMAIPNSQIEADWKQFSAFKDGVCKRLEDGEKVEVPSGIPEYAREFYLYKLGHAQWLVFRKDEDPKPFGELLALPKERRMYRTIWVHYVRVVNARRFVDKDRHIAELRQAVDAGFKDTAALDAAVLRLLSVTCGRRYDPLLITAYCGKPLAAWPGLVEHVFCGRPCEPKLAEDEDAIKALSADPIGVEIVVAHGVGGKLPEGIVRPDKPALGADRQAWIAFNNGDLELCRKLLKLAPANSLIRLFLEARLARLDGDVALSGARLHQWLDEYRKKVRPDEGEIAGYEISSWDYWSTGLGEDSYCEMNYPHFGKHGPAGNYHEYVPGRLEDDKEANSAIPTFSRIVAGELGAVMVATADLEEALYAFALAHNWIDMAFVAERCMKVDELARFIQSGKCDQKYKERLSELLMRRLMRVGRSNEAVQWAPAKFKPLCEEFVALSAIAANKKLDADERAVALFNLSRLTATRGMEQMGTELRPDVAIYEGDYDTDAVSIAEPSELPARMGMKSADSPWKGWKPPEDRVNRRFHYRQHAIMFARLAATVAKDADVRAWSLMYGGVVALTLDDVKTANWFYKRLSRMRHPRARVGAWFNCEAYRWFKQKFYEDERHAVPMRVPKRMTKAKFAELTVGK